MAEKDFSAALAKIKIPMLILDQKWHRLFALGGKPDTVKALEAKENELLKREAELKKELKELLSGSIESEEVIMQGYEVKIFKL